MLKQNHLDSKSLKDELVVVKLDDLSQKDNSKGPT